jgi:anti-anti-sigma factor
MLLDIQCRHVDPDVSVVELIGKLEMGRESQRIESLIEELLGREERKLIFDLTALDYIDSAGVGIIAYCAGKMREMGGQFALALAEGRVKKILHMTQIDALVPVYGSAAAASAALGESGLTQPPASA